MCVCVRVRGGTPQGCLDGLGGEQNIVDSPSLVVGALLAKQELPSQFWAYPCDL